MPSFNAADQVLIAGDEDFDTAMFGMPSPIVGTALSNMTFSATRANEVIMGHNKQELLHIGATPAFTSQVTGKSLLESAVLNNLSPFEPVTRADFANYVENTRHKMPDTGFFIATEVGDTAPAGTFRDTTVTLKLITTFTDSVSRVEP